MFALIARDARWRRVATQRGSRLIITYNLFINSPGRSAAQQGNAALARTRPQVLGELLVVSWWQQLVDWTPSPSWKRTPTPWCTASWPTPSSRSTPGWRSSPRRSTPSWPGSWRSPPKLRSSIENQWKIILRQEESNGRNFTTGWDQI